MRHNEVGTYVRPVCLYLGAGGDGRQTDRQTDRRTDRRTDTPTDTESPHAYVSHHETGQ